MQNHEENELPISNNESKEIVLEKDLEVKEKEHLEEKEKIKSNENLRNQEKYEISNPLYNNVIEEIVSDKDTTIFNFNEGDVFDDVNNYKEYKSEKNKTNIENTINTKFVGKKERRWDNTSDSSDEEKCKNKSI